MDTNLDTLIVALYVQIDDLFTLLGVGKGPGRPQRLTDSELVCLAVAQVMLGYNSERRWLRFAYCRLGHLFPYLPQQPAYNKRLRAACRLVAHAIRHLAGLTPSWYDKVRLLDSTPVPCGASRETVKRSELVGWARYGYCAAHSRFFWGLRLYLLTSADGGVVMTAKPAEDGDGVVLRVQNVHGAGRNVGIAFRDVVPTSVHLTSPVEVDGNELPLDGSIVRVPMDAVAVQSQRARF